MATEKPAESHPNFQAFAGKVEIGAGWAGITKGANDFVSLKRASPLQLRANLLEREGEHEGSGRASRQLSAARLDRAALSVRPSNKMAS